MDQLHEIVEFAERLKQGALIEMWLRERKALGLRPTTLEDPPQGYTGFRPKD
ncbi:hypothetical protein [Pseudomonas asiatica]|uniref:hypothetical protein n=1 Tax=Pseudomonas asiatica TaxID=2219225 RepID=UPI00201677F7|nr:hypothetical protein [Pseudomonas asiatica]